jgi:predicted component of type VI protein secretion system
MKNYRTPIANIQASGKLSQELLKEIRDVLIRMEGRLSTIESMLFVDDVAKKQILKSKLNL